MKKLADIPTPMRNKILTAPVMGVGCLAIGICMQIYASDWILLILSVILCLFFHVRSIQYLRLGRSGNYIALPATCTSVSHSPLRKHACTFKDGQGHTFTLHLSQRAYQNQCYILYFTKKTPFCELRGQPDFLVSRILSVHLIGSEQDNTIC